MVKFTVIVFWVILGLATLGAVLILGFDAMCGHGRNCFI